jgi:hypothetical protein
METILEPENEAYRAFGHIPITPFIAIISICSQSKSEGFDFDRVARFSCDLKVDGI